MLTQRSLQFRWLHLRFEWGTWRWIWTSKRWGGWDHWTWDEPLLKKARQP